MEEESETITELQKEIERHLDNNSRSSHRSKYNFKLFFSFSIKLSILGKNIDDDASKFIDESTFDTIKEIMKDEGANNSKEMDKRDGLGRECVCKITQVNN